MPRTVIALGGNALGDTPGEQLELIKATAKPIADMVERGESVVIVHGNGPQVGMIDVGLSAAAEAGVIRSPMPLPECGAMSQGYIGYHLQNAVSNELRKRRIRKNVVTIVTQVVVDGRDPAFRNPTKPVGAWYPAAEARRLSEENGYLFREKPGKGFRRVVPSPRPIDVVEKEPILRLAEAGDVVIAAGGGGIPVVRKEDGLFGVAAVIDKDFAAEKLAELIGAENLIMLTAVDAVYVDFGKPFQRALRDTSPEELEKYRKEGHFDAGSMLPKVEAAAKFASSRAGRRAVVALLQDAAEALDGTRGTVVKI